jgi:hypothetical protein
MLDDECIMGRKELANGNPKILLAEE